jgi:phosphoribosylformylglycinamidine synthase
MMAIVPKESLKAFVAIVEKHEVEYSVLGEVIKEPRLYINWGDEEIVNVPPRSVAHDGPVYERPVLYPTWLDQLNRDSVINNNLRRAAEPSELAEQLVQIVSSPNQASKSWITDQYDHYVGGNTALAMPDDSGMVRVSEETGLGVAIATDANGRYCQLDPYQGAKLALAEAYRNVASSGAVPAAVTNCLNFGSPENPEVMWQFKQATAGLADGCLELGIPVTGGNVSFYNQTGDVAIHPTPVVGVLGVIDDVARRVPSGWQDQGNNIYLLGITRDELDGSVWSEVIHDHLGGKPPVVDLKGEKALAELLHGASLQGLVASAHDLSEGGLAQAVVESSLRFGMGARFWLNEILERDNVDLTAALFSESAGRVIVSVGREDDVKFVGLCEARGIPVLRIGVTDASEKLEIQDVATWDLGDLKQAHSSTIPELFG